MRMPNNGPVASDDDPKTTSFAPRPPRVRPRTGASLFAALLLGTLFFAFGCDTAGPESEEEQEAEGGQAIVEGSVFSEITEEPVEGVKVDASVDSGSVESYDGSTCSPSDDQTPANIDITGANGSFGFCLDVPGRGSELSVVFSRDEDDLYRQESLLFNVFPGDTLSSPEVLLRRDTTGANDPGPPTAEGFSLSASASNVPALVEPGTQVRIEALLVDRYGNPVEEGTQVVFETSGGVVGRTASTNRQGRATTILEAARPFPENGIGVVEAAVLGAEGDSIKKHVPVVFSGQPTITGPSETGSGIKPDTTYRVSVEDEENANPLAEGSAVSLEVSGTNVALAGTDGSRFIGATRFEEDAGPGATKSEIENLAELRDFSFEVVADDPQGATPVVGEVTVSVEGPNGRASEAFPGSEEAGPDPANIVLEEITNEVIRVEEGGGPETSQLTFQATDGNGNPVTFDSNQEVAFDMVSGPEGADVEPDAALTDGNGEVVATVETGTASGVVQVEARATLDDGTVIRSRPVSVTITGGFPVNENFSVFPAEGNRVISGQVGNEATVNVIAGDRYNNPVVPSTAISFSSNGGIVTGSALTDADGQAQTTLTITEDRPENNIIVVTATTSGAEGQEVVGQTAIFLSGPPVRVVLEDTPFETGESYDYQVKGGINGNPLPEGTQITVEVEGENATVGEGASAEVGPASYNREGPSRENLTNYEELVGYSFEIEKEDDSRGANVERVSVTVDGPQGTVTKVFENDQGS